MSQSNGRPTLEEIADKAAEGSPLKELATATLALRRSVLQLQADANVLILWTAGATASLGRIETKLDTALGSKSEA